MISGVGAPPRIFVERETVEPLPLVADSLLVHPIPASVAATAVVPPKVDVVLYDQPRISGVGGFKTTGQSIGGLSFDLTDGYSMSVNERNSEVFVAHTGTKESVRIWGAAAIQLDGAEEARFWGTTSVVLGNGAKITLETAQDAKAADIFRLDKMTVTKDERAMVITGVSSEIAGDLAVVQSNDGHAIDEDTRDGLVIERNTLTGWADEYGITVTQAILDATAVGGGFGPGSDRMSLDEFRTLISRFLAWGQISSMMSLTSRSLTSDMLRQDPNDVARAADIRRAWARHADEAAAMERGQVRNAAMRAAALTV
jgi:Domain of Unknown Function (DUF1521)